MCIRDRGYVSKVTRYAEIIGKSGEVTLIGNETVLVNSLFEGSYTGSSGIKDINAHIYIPADSWGLSELRISRHKNEIEWEDIPPERVSLVKKGEVNIGRNRYFSYFLNLSLHMFNKEGLRISYKFKTKPGLRDVINRLSGYNMYENKLIFEDITIPFVVPEVVRKVGLEVFEEEWVQGYGVVEYPVPWMKKIEVRNNNPYGMKKEFKTRLLPDVLNAHLITGEGKKNIKMEMREGNIYGVWTDFVEGYTTKTYYVQAFTPPVLISEQYVDVVTSGKTATLKTTLDLVNYAVENYTNISLIVPIPYEDMVNATDIYMNIIRIEREGKGSRLIIPFIEGKGVSSISMFNKLTPPVMIIRPNKYSYKSSVELVNISVIIIAKERMRGLNLEIEVFGPKSRPDTLFLDAVSIDVIPKGGVYRVVFTFPVYPLTLPEGRYIIEARLRKDMWGVFSQREEFFMGSEMPLEELKIVIEGFITKNYGIGLGIGAIIILLVAYLIIRRRKRRSPSHKETLEYIRKKLQRM